MSTVDTVLSALTLASMSHNELILITNLLIVILLMLFLGMAIVGLLIAPEQSETHRRTH